MQKSLLLTAVIAFSAAACGGDSTAPRTGGNGGTGVGTPGGGSVQCPANTICMAGVVFSPTTLTVARGTGVTFLNNSGIIHNVMFGAIRSPGVTDIPNHSSGSNDRVFSAAGTWQFACSLHAGMVGQIVVQ